MTYRHTQNIATNGVNVFVTISRGSATPANRNVYVTFPAPPSEMDRAPAIGSAAERLRTQRSSELLKRHLVDLK